MEPDSVMAAPLLCMLMMCKEVVYLAYKLQCANVSNFICVFVVAHCTACLNVS